MASRNPVYAMPASMALCTAAITSSFSMRFLRVLILSRHHPYGNGASSIAPTCAILRLSLLHGIGLADFVNILRVGKDSSCRESTIGPGAGTYFARITKEQMALTPCPVLL